MTHNDLLIRCEPKVKARQIPIEALSNQATCLRVLINVIQRTAAAHLDNKDDTASGVRFNDVVITKPHAVERLTTDLIGYNVDVAVVIEMHLKKRHPDHHFVINGCSLFRHDDRAGRRGGGVAV